MVLHAEKPGELQGKRATTRISEITWQQGTASMVRRGSTVRVRQRALQKSCKKVISVQAALQMLQCALGMEPLMEL
jgi:hypothetical protein